MYYSDNTDTFELKPLTGTQEPKKNFWKLSSEAINDIDNASKVSPIANVILPIVFIIAGGFFIFQQFKPEIQQKIRKQNGLLTQGTVSPVSDEYVSLSDYISNPKGLDDLTKNALSKHILQEDTQSLNFNEVFYISIPSLGMDRLPVAPNVDSSSESSYSQALEDSLAHFKYTGLPVSDVKNNIVVYGHSASPSFNPQRNDPVVAFSYLQELKVGDDIIIEIASQTYKFKMQRSKIVEPDDISIINGTPGKRTLTLFTCFPNGSNSKRYVAVAREV